MDNWETLRDARDSLILAMAAVETPHDLTDDDVADLLANCQNTLAKIETALTEAA